MYSRIINPETGRKVNVNSKLGKHVLKHYLSGGNPTEADNNIEEEIAMIVRINKELEAQRNEIQRKIESNMVRKAHLEKLNQVKKTKKVSSKSAPKNPRVIPSELNYGVPQSRSNNRSQGIPSELNW